jgi:hypothetical protein
MPGEIVTFASAPTPIACVPGQASIPVSPRVAALVTSQNRTSRFDENGTFLGINENWMPGPVTPTDMPDLRQQLAILNEALAPADKGALLARVLTLLSHFPAKDLPPEVEQMMALDWAEDLGEFPAWAIDHAARIWRRTKKWRPSISEMRTLCQEAVAEDVSTRERVRKLLVKAEEAIEPQAASSTASNINERIRRLAAAKRMP